MVTCAAAHSFGFSCGCAHCMHAMCTLQCAVSSEAAVLQLISSAAVSSDADAAEKFTRVFIVAQSLSSSWVQFAFCPSCLLPPSLLALQTALHPSIHPLIARPEMAFLGNHSVHNNWCDHHPHTAIGGQYTLGAET